MIMSRVECVGRPLKNTANQNMRNTAIEKYKSLRIREIQEIILLIPPMIMSRVGCMERPYSQSASAPGSSFHYYTSLNQNAPYIHILQGTIHTADSTVIPLGPNAPCNVLCFCGPIQLFHLSAKMHLIMYSAHQSVTFRFRNFTVSKLFRYRIRYHKNLVSK